MEVEENGATGVPASGDDDNTFADVALETPVPRPPVMTRRPATINPPKPENRIRDQVSQLHRLFSNNILLPSLNTQIFVSI